MTDPKVSVLIATYNRSHLLPRSIQSVLDQTYSQWELIIADDGSADTTQEVVSGFVSKDKRIVYIRAPHFGSIAKISNFGLKTVKGKYVAILDDDDWWANIHKLEKQVDFLERHPDYVACGGGMIVVDAEGKPGSRFLKAEKDVDIRDQLLVSNPIINSSSLFRLDLARDLNFYDEKISHLADWDFWLKMGLRGKFYNFPEYFVFYRIWPESVSFKKQRSIASASLDLVFRYRRSYSHFPKALLLSLASAGYSLLPRFITSLTNPILSRLKKFLFSSR